MEQQLTTDLLVIGGGFGGLFAAIQARKLGVRDVLIVDKGAVGLTGQSRMAAGATLFVHPGDDVESWADAIFRGQNGLCNQDMVLPGGLHGAAAGDRGAGRRLPGGSRREVPAHALSRAGPCDDDALPAGGYGSPDG